MALINSDVIPASATTFEIEQSLRFNDDDSAYLNWTPSSAGNRRTWTWSGWVKRGNLDTGVYNHYLFNTVNGEGVSLLTTPNTNVMQIQGCGGELVTNAVFRDSSAWYHILVSVDSTNATADDRVRVYVNGSEVTDFSSRTNPTLNAQGAINNNIEHLMGRQLNLSRYFDGYLAEVNFIDGQQLDPTYFGETGDYGEWKPIEYTGSYGTNGFYLDFDGTYYNDKSGNGNNWTANNLSATDVVLDSPTNNFCVMNPIDNTSGELPESFSQGNLRVDTPASGNGFATGTMGMSSGKWYWELRMEGYDGIPVARVGIHGDCYPTDGELATASCGYSYGSYSGQKVNNNSGSGYGASWTTGDIIGVAYDADNGNLTFYKNGTSQGTAYTGITGTMRPAMSDASGSSYGVIIGFNFGQDSSFYGTETAQGNTDDNNIGDFYYTPPSGYLALCTANLPDPDVIPSENFNTVLYEGNASTEIDVSVGFQPDFIWIKNRSNANSSSLTDSIRGVDKWLISDYSGAERNDTSNNSGVPRINSIGSDGFQVNDNANSEVNYTGYNYVAWNWKANGSGVSNTDGSITSTVSANQDAGFSIVSYTGTGSNATVGHGLSSAPELVIVKSRTNSGFGWAVYNEDIGNTNSLRLHDTSASFSATTYWNSTSPTSSVFSIGTSGNSNENSGNYIAYCFHSVDGFSKVGSYTGNGSSDGPFVYTGFRPAFVMRKRTDSVGSWRMHDSERNTYNVANLNMVANDSQAEASSGNEFDMLSNGFKCRATNGDTNASGATYIYIAFAENPFKHTNAR